MSSEGPLKYPTLQTNESGKHFFQGIDLVRFLKIALSLGGVAALVHELAEINSQTALLFSLVSLLRSYGLYASCCFLSLVFAEKVSVQPFLVEKEKRVERRVMSLLFYGLLPGILIGLVYTKQFAPFRYSPRVPLWIRLIEGQYDVFIYSLRAAVTEELAFRLLLFTAFLYILRRAFHPLLSQGCGITRWIPLMFSVLVSSLLFGTVHGLYGFSNALVAGIILCICFLRGGFESAVLCHFMADFVFYNLVYVRVDWLRGV